MRPTSSSSIRRDGDDYVINGRKWWITGAMNPECRRLHRHGQDRPFGGPAPAAVDDPRPARHPRSRGRPRHGGLRLRRPRPRRPRRAAVLRRPRARRRTSSREEGMASPSRRPASAPAASTTACARSVWPRSPSRRCAAARPSGSPSAGRSPSRASSATGSPSRACASSSCACSSSRPRGSWTPSATRAPTREIQAIKIATPKTVEWILDKAIQTHGAAGLSQDTELAAAFAGIRTLRFADGPDEVHKNALAKAELRRYAAR